MESLGIADLKEHLSEHLKSVKSGHELVVTERGVLIAKIVPLKKDEMRATRVDRLARSGRIRLGKVRLRPMFAKPPPPEAGTSRKETGVLAALLLEREEGR